MTATLGTQTATPDRFRWLFEGSAGHGIALLDLDGRITDWNRAAESLTGHSSAEAVGRDLAWLHGHADAAAVPADALEAASRETTVTFRSWWRRKDGTRFWCEASLAVLRDEAGAVRGYSESLLDATAIQQAQASVQATEARFAAALRSAPVLVFNQDTELRYTWVPLFAHQFGLESVDRVLGHTDDDLFPPAAAARLREIKRGVLESGTGANEEIPVETDAGTLHFSLTVEPLRDDDGDIVGITCTTVDVTARRRTEDELRRSTARLAEAERVARFGSWEWDIARDQITWSDGLFEIYGLTPETFDARFAARTQRVHPDDHDRVEAAVRRALETAGSFELDYRIMRPDGRVRLLHGRAEVIVDDKGKPVRLAGTAQDVTEVRAAEDALEQTAGELGRRAAELHRVTHPAGGEPDVARLLSARQLEILGLIAEGFGNAEIAARLFLTEATVKWHVRKILQKLGVANRAQAVGRYLAGRAPQRH